MLKKILIGGLIAIVVLFAGAFFWARSVLTGENVRAALAAQVEKAIGQPVSIGTISATITPRVTMTLGEVRIGRPERIQVAEVHVGTDLRACCRAGSSTRASSSSPAAPTPRRS